MNFRKFRHSKARALQSAMSAEHISWPLRKLLTAVCFSVCSLIHSKHLDCTWHREKDIYDRLFYNHSHICLPCFLNVRKSDPYVYLHLPIVPYTSRCLLAVFKFVRIEYANNILAKMMPTFTFNVGIIFAYLQVYLC